jgi:hypothetical protein
VRCGSLAKMRSDFELIDVENEADETWDAGTRRLQVWIRTSSEWLRSESLPKLNLNKERRPGGIRSPAER